MWSSTAHTVRSQSSASNQERCPCWHSLRPTWRNDPNCLNPEPHPHRPSTDAAWRLEGDSRSLRTRRWSRGARGPRAAVAEDRTPIGAKFRIGASFKRLSPLKQRRWRKRVRVELTTRLAKSRIAGFEGREGHRTPFASAVLRDSDY